MFLYSAFLKDKKLFVLLAVFILLQIHFYLVEKNSTPFYTYDMYSHPDHGAAEYSSLYFNADGQDVNYMKLPYYTHFFLEMSTGSQLNLNYNHGKYDWNDSISAAMDRFKLSRERKFFLMKRITNEYDSAVIFRQFTKRYLEEAIHKKIDTLRVGKVYFHYPDCTIQRRDTLFTI